MFYDRKKDKSILPGLEGLMGPDDYQNETYDPNQAAREGNSGATGVVSSGTQINSNAVGNQAGGTYIPSGGANYTGSGTAPAPYSPPSPVPRAPVVSPPLINTVVPSSTGGQSVATAVAAYQAQLAAPAQALRYKLLAQRAAAAKPATVQSTPPAPPAYVSPGSTPPIPPPLIPAPSTKQVAVVQSFATKFPVKTAIIHPVKQASSTWVNGSAFKPKPPIDNVSTWTGQPATRAQQQRAINSAAAAGGTLVAKVGESVWRNGLQALRSIGVTSGNTNKLSDLLRRHKFTETGINSQSVNTGISDSSEMTPAQFKEYAKANSFVKDAVSTLRQLAGSRAGASKSQVEKDIADNFGRDLRLLIDTAWDSGDAAGVTAGQRYIAARDLYNYIGGVKSLSSTGDIASQIPGAVNAFTSRVGSTLPSAVRSAAISAGGAYLTTGASQGVDYVATGEAGSDALAFLRRTAGAFSPPPVVATRTPPPPARVDSGWTQAGLAEEIKRQQSFVDDTGAASDSSPSAQREVSLLNQLKQQYENKFGGSVASSDAPINYNVNPFTVPLFDQPRKYVPPPPEPISHAPDYSNEISQLQQSNNALNQRIARIVNSPNFDSRTQGREVQSMLDQIRGNNNYIQDYQSRSVRPLPRSTGPDKTIDKVGLVNLLKRIPATPVVDPNSPQARRDYSITAMSVSIAQHQDLRKQAMNALTDEMQKGPQSDPATRKALADNVTKLDQDIAYLKQQKVKLLPNTGMGGVMNAMSAMSGAGLAVAK